MYQMLGNLARSPLNWRRALGFGAAACAIGAGYTALRCTSKTGGGDIKDSSDGLEEVKKRLRRLQQRSVAGTRVSTAWPSTTPAHKTGEGPTGGGVSGLPSKISSSAAVKQSTMEPAVASFSTWVKGPFIEFSQVPIAYFRASIVNGGSTMRISAADQAIEAAMADVELLFARSFASSADAYAAMASELVGGRTVEAAATGKRGKKVHASGETPNRAAVEESIIAGVNFIKAAQIAAVKADAALVTAMNETDQAVRAAVGVSGSLHAAWLKTPPRAENSSSVAGLLYDFTVAKAALKGSKKSNQVVKQGVAAWEKAQDARQRIRKLSAHVRHVFAAVRYAENELKMVRHPERRGMSRLLEAAFALNCLSEAVEGAIACSKGAVDGSALKGPRE